MIIEVCVDTLDSALNAQTAGANRIELCADLALGGTTPSYGLIKLCRKYLNIDIYVMIRPRCGDFCYSDMEFETMKMDVENAKNLKMDGVVFGILDEYGYIDKKRMKELIDIAKPMKVTIHRAFDMSKDIFKSLEDAVDLGIDRILTSAQSNKVYENLKLLQELIEKADGKIVVMAGSGINENNVREVIKTGVLEVHASGKVEIESKMKFRRTNISMGASSSNKEYKVEITSIDKIKKLINET